MGRHKKVKGICRLCGKENVDLTFEHVPPSSSYNNEPVQAYEMENVIKNFQEGRYNIADMVDLHYKSLQRGDGGYYLCSSCNSKTGAWYVKQYSSFIKNAMYAIEPINVRHGNILRLLARESYPLAIFKQIMVMFCDINSTLSNDIELRDFLLTPTSRKFNTKKYRLFIFCFGGGFLRRTPFEVIYIGAKDRYLKVSEIISPPFGFQLYIDLPDDYETNDCEITEFAQIPYDERRNLEIIMQTKETYSFIPGVYLPKEEK